MAIQTSHFEHHQTLEHNTKISSAHKFPDFHIQNINSHNYQFYKIQILKTNANVRSSKVAY